MWKYHIYFWFCSVSFQTELMADKEVGWKKLPFIRSRHIMLASLILLVQARTELVIRDIKTLSNMRQICLIYIVIYIFYIVWSFWTVLVMFRFILNLKLIIYIYYFYIFPCSPLILNLVIPHKYASYHQIGTSVFC